LRIPPGRSRRRADILRAGDVGHRPRAESIAVFNRARAEWQKAVYAINDALGDASGEALAIMLRAAGDDDLSLDDFFGAMHEIPYEDNPRLEALLVASGWLVRKLPSTNAVIQHQNAGGRMRTRRVRPSGPVSSTVCP
jgi:hypothetical protein